MKDDPSQIADHLIEQHGVPQDYAKALQWNRKAAAQGVAEAQYNLGVIYKFGLGVPQDYAKALQWYRKAAEQGVAKAQFNLGLMYDNGLGVKQDYAKGAKWYRKAASRYPPARTAIKRSRTAI